jgi:hypothetical protein
MLCTYLPDNFDPSSMTEEQVEAIHALNREITAAGAERFACGLFPASYAKTLRKQSSGKVSVTDGPYIETKEHIGGLMILEAADLDEALAWARKGVLAGGGAGVCEVRELLFFPDPKEATA